MLAYSDSLIDVHTVSALLFFTADCWVLVYSIYSYIVADDDDVDVHAYISVLIN